MRISLKIIILNTLLILGCTHPEKTIKHNNYKDENQDKRSYFGQSTSFKKLAKVILASFLFQGNTAQTPSPTLEPPDELRPFSVLENNDMFDLNIANSQFLADTGTNELLVAFTKDENNGKGTIINIDNNENNTLGWQLTLDNNLGSAFSSVIQLDGFNLACGSVEVMGDGIITPNIHSDILLAANTDGGTNINAINLEVRLPNGTSFIGRDERCTSIYPSGSSSGIITASITGVDIDDHLYIANVSGIDGSVSKDYVFVFPEGISDLIPITMTSNNNYVIGLTSNSQIHLLNFDINFDLNNTYSIPVSTDSILH